MPPVELSSVANALRLLQLLRARADIGVKDAADYLQTGRSTAHRLLATLQEHGFVEQTGARRYRLGPAMTATSTAQAIDHCIEVAQPFMEQLRDESGETVHIACLAGDRARFISSVESHRMVRAVSRNGYAAPAHCSAAGKVLLAQLTAEEFHAIYRAEGLVGGTSRALGTKSALMYELSAVRTAGYGRNMGESEEGLAALAVPIVRPDGPVLCTLTVTGPAFRFNDVAQKVSPNETRLVALLRRFTDLISGDLAY